MKRKFKFITTAITLMMSIAFLAMGVFSLEQRQVSINGTITFTSESVSADVIIRHSRNSNSSLNYTSSMARAVAETLNETNDIEFRMGNSASQEAKDVVINFPNDASKRLEIDDNNANYTYYVVIKNIFPENSQSAILVDLKEGFEGFDGGFYTKEIRKDYLSGSILQPVLNNDLVTHQGKQMIYLAAGQTVVLSISFTANLEISKTNDVIPFNSNFELIKY
jgi:hypothetical protein